LAGFDPEQTLANKGIIKIEEEFAHELL
jgi:hypothetical protein